MRREVFLSCKTEESGVAVPRIAVQSPCPFSKDAWNKEVLAWATDAISRQKVRPNICHLLTELRAQNNLLNGAPLVDIFHGIPRDGS